MNVDPRRQRLPIVLSALLWLGWPTGSGALVLEGDPRRFPASIVEEAALSATPLSIDVPVGQSARDAASSFCGHFSESYEAILEERFARLNPHAPSLDNPALVEVSVTIPYCFRVPEPTTVPVTVQAAKSVWDFFLEVEKQGVITPASTTTAGANGGDRLLPSHDLGQPVAVDVAFTGAQIEAISTLGRDLNWPTYVEAFERANQAIRHPDRIATGQIVNVPVLPSLTYSVGFEDAESERQFAELAAAADGATAHPEEAPFGELEGSLSASELKTFEEDCGSDPTAALLRSQDALTEIFHALLINDELRPAGDERGNAYVLIADSGLDGYLADSPRPPFIESTIALGALGGGRGEIVSDIRNAKHTHGTSVASIALGGPLFAWTNAFSNSPIKLMFTRIDDARVTDGQVTHQVSMEKLSNVDNMLNSNANVHIVNMSFRLSKSPDLFYKASMLGTNSPLFIVAAGNQGQPLDTFDTWPARFGGNAANNVLTVAATDWSGALAEFSNRSATYVEIAALGCRVPALRFDESAAVYRPSLESGTSMAAPLVAFAAALVAAELPGVGPRHLKNRLLVAADFNPNLFGMVRDGRELNIARALSVFTDIVEFSNKPPVRGQVLLDHELIPLRLCATGSFVRQDELRRLSLVEGASGPRLWVVFERDDGAGETRLLTESCDVTEATGRVRVVDRATHTEQVLDWSTARDVTMAMWRID